MISILHPSVKHNQIEKKANAIKRSINRKHNFSVDIVKYSMFNLTNLITKVKESDFIIIILDEDKQFYFKLCLSKGLEKKTMLIGFEDTMNFDENMDEIALSLYSSSFDNLKNRLISILPHLISENITDIWYSLANSIFDEFKQEKPIQIQLNTKEKFIELIGEKINTHPLLLGIEDIMEDILFAIIENSIEIEGIIYEYLEELNPLYIVVNSNSNQTIVAKSIGTVNNK